MRIENHPVLSFNKSEAITFLFDGKPVEAFTGETIAAALHAAGIRVLSHSDTQRPRGLFCAIGNCSSCMMVVDGKPNVKICVVQAINGMTVETQIGKGDIL